MNSLQKKEWKDIIIKSKHIYGVPAKRAGVILDSAVDDPANLLLVVKRISPFDVIPQCQVDVLFHILSKMGKKNVIFNAKVLFMKTVVLILHINSYIPVTFPDF